MRKSQLKKIFCNASATGLDRQEPSRAQRREDRGDVDLAVEPQECSQRRDFSPNAPLAYCAVIAESAASLEAMVLVSSPVPHSQDLLETYL
jgi:hypothetical protein